LVEQVFRLAIGDVTAVNRLILDENVHYIHMQFEQGKGLPEHHANSNVYMTVVRGTLSIGLDEQETHAYAAGHVLKIPVRTKMRVQNLHPATLELIVVKAPAPQA